MIKVTVREKVYTDGIYKEEEKIKEHKDGARAQVFNGVLTIYTVMGTVVDFQNAIAGYEPGTWISWLSENE